MRGLIVISALAATAAAPPAETNIRAALERVTRIDSQLHSVIAVDPTAIDQARALTRAICADRSPASRC